MFFFLGFKKTEADSIECDCLADEAIGHFVSDARRPCRAKRCFSWG